ncbi:MAG: TetR/AcrR family transcriptional regulator [Ruminiclostridium sp.]|nr:TetR/AcrR family transcriptional regulator [Ruminiclostridium sp.]MBQ9933384.1 TetR/AcrR family transcriptional regulator [Ruminiclostridium sp.]
MDKRKAARQRVRTKITEALLELMGEKPFSEISVIEIVNRAGVARQSYYRNFSSKEKVVEGFYFGLRDLGLAEMRRRQPENDCQWVSVILEVMSTKREELLRLYHGGFSKVHLDIINQFVEDAAGDMPAFSPDRYKLYCYAGAVYNTTLVWYQGGCRETPEEVARIICSFQAVDLLPNLVEYASRLREEQAPAEE